MTRVFHTISVLESELAPWLALGWTEIIRDNKPFTDEDIVLLEWHGENPIVVAK